MEALKERATTLVDKPQNLARPYIIKKMDKVPAMGIKTLEVKSYFVDLQIKASI